MIGTPHILLVEDSRNDEELTLEALSQHGLANAVDVARDGVEALDYLYKRGDFSARISGHPVVVLLDLKLPKVDGKEVLKTIKSDPMLKNIPVVALTSSREERDLVESYNLGVNAYVVKPVEFKEFIQAIGEIGLFWAVLNEVPRA